MKVRVHCTVTLGYLGTQTTPATLSECGPSSSVTSVTSATTGAERNRCAGGVRGRRPSEVRSCNRSDDATQRLDSDRGPNRTRTAPLFR